MANPNSYLIFTFHQARRDPRFLWPESYTVWGPSLKIENDKYIMSFQCHPAGRKMRWRNGKNSVLNGLQWEYLTYANFTGMYNPLSELYKGHASEEANDVKVPFTLHCICLCF